MVGDNYPSGIDFGSICLQTVQSTVVNSNLNPVWNEELMLSVPLEYGVMKVVSLNFCLVYKRNNFISFFVFYYLSYIIKKKKIPHLLF